MYVYIRRVCTRAHGGWWVGEGGYVFVCMRARARSYTHTHTRNCARFTCTNAKHTRPMGVDQSPLPHTINLELIHLFVNLQQSAPRFVPFSSNLVKPQPRRCFLRLVSESNSSVLPSRENPRRAAFLFFSNFLASLLSSASLYARLYKIATNCSKVTGRNMSEKDTLSLSLCMYCSNSRVVVYLREQEESRRIYRREPKESTSLT